MHLFSWLAVTGGAILFFLSHPNIFFHNGLFPLGFFALLPVFLAIRTSSFKTVWLKGFFYGILSYGLSCYWLASFNPYTLYIALFCYGLILALVFVLLKLADKAFCTFCGGRFCLLAFFAQALVWCSYEYLKTLGFVGFSYGVLGYTQWNNLPLLQNAAWGGVWPLSLACAMVSASAASVFFRAHAIKKEETKKRSPSLSNGKCLKKSLLANRLPLSFTLAGLLLMFAYGAIVLALGKGTNPSALKSVKILCIQNNTDSEKYGVDVYRRDIKNLTELTKEALSQNPDAQIVVWPETAVVPPVEYHYQKRVDFDRVEIINRLLEFVAGKDCAFVIGNQRTVESSPSSSDDYNAALVFDSSLENVIPPTPLVYEKIHLVPFAEWFPYKNFAPGLYKKLLLDNDRLWTPGSQYVVFNVRSVKFSVPICFEDTFGSLCRRFVLGGAEVFVNISNDSWSLSVPCQKQHLAMSVFRCAENRVPCARSTASGVTAFVDSFGRVVAETPPFQQNFLCCKLKIPQEGSQKKTLYTAFGDWFAILIASAGILLESIALLHALFGSRRGRVVEKEFKNEVK
ncbi:MAG: apolipoprotein N-acyltransferase [Treponema sp.]|nr:apolipoprotein N-acyltransferase [Treponema sp.]